MPVQKPIKITETVLRDAHQSLIATRMPTELMLPIVDKMDKVGYHSVECWGGATFDACLRFLKEDPWDRLRKLRDGFKNTKLQMLFRGQNILGYRHYADDVVEYFVQKSIANGIDIIRIFDCLNDLRNLECAVKACNKEKGHAQVALSYTLGDAYTLDYWTNIAKEIEDMGVKIAHVTLHVGLGTFRPVKVEDVTNHEMHSEYYIVEESQAKMINDAKAAGGRIISVGTTSTRTLESVALEDGTIPAKSGWTEIFIYPGYKFKAIDCLITNFHLPESTLIMLVSALAGREHVLAAYEEAVKERYRFFSFGDAMFIQ